MDRAARWDCVGAEPRHIAEADEKLGDWRRLINTGVLGSGWRRDRQNRIAGHVPLRGSSSTDDQFPIRSKRLFTDVGDAPDLLESGRREGRRCMTRCAHLDAMVVVLAPTRPHGPATRRSDRPTPKRSRPTANRVSAQAANTTWPLEHCSNSHRTPVRGWRPSSHRAPSSTLPMGAQSGRLHPSALP